MSFTMKNFGKRISRQARRTFVAMLVSGPMVSSSFCELSIASAFETHDSFLADASAEPSASAPAIAVGSSQSNKPDYWIFSDDYCGWASAEFNTLPYSVNPFATEPTRRSRFKNRVLAADAVDRALANRSRKTRVNLFAKPATLLDTAIGKALSNLTSPPSVAARPTEVVEEPSLKLVGSSPIIVSIAEGYLPYDLISEEQVELRNYPISIPQFRYLGGRRTMDQSISDYGPLDCLGHGVVWSEEALPSQSVSIGQPSRASEKSSLWNTASDRLNQAKRFLAQVTSSETAKVDAKRRAIAIAINKSIQPQSQLRDLLDPDRFGVNAATSLASIRKATQDQLQTITQSIANNLQLDTPETRAEQLEKSAGERLLVRAGIEVDSLDCATAGVADVVQDRVCCPVERCDLAAQCPSTHHFAAVGVAAATLKMPLRPHAFVAEPIDRGFDGIARAEALATACDNAAATLERVAMALRRAGDSVVRVAKATSNEAGAGLR